MKTEESIDGQMSIFDFPEVLPNRKCIHKSSYPCTIVAASKVAISMGENCNSKCCWNCKELCGCRCNSSAHELGGSKYE